TYTTSYLVTYQVSGAENAFDPPEAEWVAKNGVASGSFTAVVTVGGVRDTFVGDNRPATITAPTTITGTYQTSYWVTYVVTGAQNSIVPPASEWVIKGQTATGIFPSVVTVGGVTDTFVGDNRPSTITAPTTITGVYGESYWVTYVVSGAQNSISAPAGEWVAKNGVATRSFTAVVTVDGVKDTLVGDDRPASITGPTTITGTYQTSYWVTYQVSGNENPISAPASEWVNKNAAASGVFPDGSTVGGVRVTFTGDNRPSAITAPTTITGTYQTSYLVTYQIVGSHNAFDAPQEEWVNKDGVATGSFTAIVTVGSTRDVFVRDNRPLTITGPTTITGIYQTQYYLTVFSVYGSTTGSGWYDAGTTAYAHLNIGTVAGSAGTQYVFTSWITDASGGNYVQSNGITMNAPKTATANWKTQYYLTVSSDYGSPTGTGWYDSGSTANFAVTSPVSGGTGTRYVFTAWSGDSFATSTSASITMNSAKTVTANWQTQYQVTFTVAPSGSGTASPVGNDWVNAGSVSISATASTGYAFASWTSTAGTVTSPTSAQTTVTITGPGTVTANFNSQASPTSTPTPTTAPTESPTPTETPAPTPTPTETPTETPSPTPTPSATPISTPEPQPLTVAPLNIAIVVATAGVAITLIAWALKSGMLFKKKKL
ncbi:MAG: hypothetical protein NWE98_12440, partial [Candidatus Bathyarchaeota archaeon]|nr:hypothetical protein [Candidatus Bathyarchaeota archaeon]